MKFTFSLLPALAISFLSLSLSVAEPERDVSARRHPNLAAAQHHIDLAFERITAAQKANEFDMDGHAAKAKELLEQAAREVKLAAEAANANRK